jgi:hypothetical protein
MPYSKEDQYQKFLLPLSDNFIFTHLDDQCAFPRVSEQKIFQYYNDFKKEIQIN